MTTKEFEKQTLDQLLIDLKDIDNYKSFRKGAFVYDLGYYQGQLLLNEINRLNNIISEALGIANERINYYYHNKNDELLKEWEEIFVKLVKRDTELKGDNK
jgi:hypothetical protein